MAAHIETHSMVTPDTYSSKLLNHLGLVAGMYDELGLGERIDQLLPQASEKRTVSLGQAVKAMVLNGLGFAHRALYLTPQFFRDKPVDRLIGEGVEAKHLNDDVLGRALEAIYEYGPDVLYPQLVAPALSQLGLSSRFGHLDTTSFHTEGRYNSDEKAEEGVIHITKGYSRDHRPDLNQVVLQLICERQAGIPLWMQPLSGNSSDQNSFRELVQTHVEQLRTDYRVEYLIADAALYTKETLPALKPIHWISRVPETLTLAGEIIHAIAPDWRAQPDKPAFRSLSTVYGEVRQRWVVVYSPAAYHRSRKTIDRQCRQQSTAELKAFDKLCQHDFACAEDAQKALVAFTKTQRLTELTNPQVEALPRYHGKGRPARGRTPDFYVYRTTGTIASLPAQRLRRLDRKSCFILATNQLDHHALSDEELIAAYKDQQKVERGFRFLKDPLFMASTLFLESPQRIMALMMIMTLCLLVYAALEHRLREALKTHEQTFPNQQGKPVSNPTARWVFQYFSGIHLLCIAQTHVLVLNLNEHHQALLHVLGERYERLYSGSG